MASELESIVRHFYLKDVCIRQAVVHNVLWRQHNRRSLWHNHSIQREAQMRKVA